MRARGVMGGEAWPEHHRRGVAEGGAEKFVVIKMPTQWGRGIPNDFIAEYVGRYPGRAVGFAAVDPTEAGRRRASSSGRHEARSPRAEALPRLPRVRSLESRRSGALYEMADAVPRYRSCSTWAGPTIRKRRSSGAAPCLLDRVGRAFPRLRMIVAHLGQPMMQETVMLMRKNENVFADLSARFHRRWQLYNGLRTAIEYRVTDRLLFGSDFPVTTTREAARAFQAINDWEDGVRLPPIPPELIDQILYERPLELLGLA